MTATAISALSEAGHGPMRVLSFGSPSSRRDQMTFCIGRRDFIALLGGAGVACVADICDPLAHDHLPAP
jgi:hypothetical protein